MKKVTVIIPVYNSQEWLSRLLDTVISQDFGIENIELILVNDKSTDQSLEIIKSYSQQYPESIQYIDKKINEGVAAARDDGLKRVNTPYFMFLDNDDFIDSDYVSVLYREIESEALDLVISGYRLVDINKEVIKTNSYEVKYGANYEAPCIWGSIHRTDYVRLHEISYRGRSGDDMGFVYQEFLYTNKIKYIPYIGYNWFENSSSLSRGGRPNIEKNIYEILDFLKVGMANNKIGDYKYNYYLIYTVFYSYHLLSSKASVKDFKRYFYVLIENMKQVYPQWTKLKVPENTNSKI